MEKDFEIGYALVSLIFVSNAIGFIVSAFFVDMLRAKLGRARLLILAQTLMLCGYIPIICSGGHKWAFPLVVVSFVFLGENPVLFQEITHDLMNFDRSRDGNQSCFGQCFCR